MGGSDLMRTFSGAMRAIGLLVGFYVFTLGTLIVLVGMDVALVLHMGGDTPVFAEGKVIGMTVVVAIPLVRGLLISRRRRGKEPLGVPVTPQEQPELWARVRGLAKQVGTRPPDEILLVPMVNAAVSEDAHLMGLLPGRRRMYVGMPLLLGLTSPQLDAVLAHELGHYSSQDVRLAAMTVRGQDAVLGVAHSCQDSKVFPQGLMNSFFTWFAEVYLRTSQSARRRQELAADQMAVRIAGRDNAAAALRRIPALEAAYGFYVDRYVFIGWNVDLLPPPEKFYEGLYALLIEPSRQAELESLRSAPPQKEPAKYDSHPPIHERIGAVESLPDDGRAPTGPEPEALTVLRNAQRVCAEVATVALPPEAAGKRLVDWAELARGAGRAALVHDSSLILQTASAAVGTVVADLPTLLDVVDARWLDTIADALPKSERAQQATGRVAREFARTAVRDAITPLVLLALVDGGRASWMHNWARPLHLEYDEGLEAAIAAALTALIAETPDTRPLRSLLHDLAPVPAR